MLLSEKLVGQARERRQRKMEAREQAVVGGMAIAFVAMAGTLAFVLPMNRAVDVPLMVGLVIGYAVVSRVRFEFASEYVSAEQLVFVPMLVLLPINLVPLLVALASVLAVVPDLTSGVWDKKRWIVAVGDCAFAIGPAVVVALLASSEPTLNQAPVYTLALASEFLTDSAWWWIRYQLLDPIPFPEFLRISVSTLELDAVLSPVAFMITLVAVDAPLALLAIGPLVWILQVFSRDRTERYSATLELNRAYRGTVMLLVDVVEHEDGYTASHCRSVIELVQSVAEEMKVDPNDLQELECAALLHDVGKISVPKEILNKPAALDQDEQELLRTHTIEGQFMLDRVGGMLGRVGEIVRSCHERWDGGGYPDGLSGEEIPLAARIVFVCDAYNAMTTDRPYRAAMPNSAARAELTAHAGTQFDPEVVSALIKVVQQGEPEMGAAEEMRAALANVSVSSRRVKPVAT